MGITLNDLREIEKNLKQVSDLLLNVNENDRRVLYLWAEYLVALQIKEQHPDWNVDVTGNIGSPDVLIENGKKIRIQVKTGKWQRYEFDSEVMYSADASFGKGNQIKSKRFDCLVFIILDRAEIKETLIFSIDELQEIDARRTMVGHPTTNYCLLSRVESMEKWKKWIKHHKIIDPIYKIERDVVEHPEKYRDNWDKINAFASES